MIGSKTLCELVCDACLADEFLYWIQAALFGCKLQLGKACTFGLLGAKSCRKVLSHVV